MKEKSEFFSKVKSIFTENSLENYLEDEILEKFYYLTEIMLETNEKMNITAITDIDAVIARHYADSLIMLTAGIEKNSKVCDVGCGGGFPSFPIAIARPDLTIIGIDSTAKKVSYVNETAKKIGLSNLSAISGRAEELCGTYRSELKLRESFDVVCARAVASLPVLSELCLPFVKPGGRFIALKSRTAEDELKAAKSGITKLGGKIEKTEKMVLKDKTLSESTDAERTLITIRKIGETPNKYPRAYAQIKKKPL